MCFNYGYKEGNINISHQTSSTARDGNQGLSKLKGSTNLLKWKLQYASFGIAGNAVDVEQEQITAIDAPYGLWYARGTQHWNGK
ncbi:unnamed protein product [Linum tenue]|uniref:Uncharacterized protein n=1 Tax=Linum tenue TaxID=586396 RepID=A0AAV0IG20_9ROSI|nr:unnamed protein product [Linum tenue]